jgi:hypothetical protein
MIKDIYKCVMPRVFTPILIFVFLSGCAFKGSMDEEQMTEHLSKSNYQVIAAVYLKDGKPNYNENNLLETLKAGKAFNDAGMWLQSKRAFDIAHKKIAWKEDSIDTPSEVLNMIGTTMTSSKFGAYQGKIFEGGMLDYYQAINELMLGDEENSRVAFRRFDERMKNTVTQLISFSDATKKQAVANFSNDSGGTSISSYKQVSDKLGVGIAQAPTGLTDPQLRIAIGEFMSGVFRATSSVVHDKKDNFVMTPLKNAYASSSSPGGSLLVEQTFNNLKTNKLKSKGKVYIVYEDGQGPTFDEYRIDLPLFLVSDKVTYSGIALPVFVPGKPAFGNLVLDGTPTEVLTNINNISAMEFQIAYPGIVTKAIVSTVIKTAAQIAANALIDKETKDNKTLGAFLKLGVGVTQAVLTQADDRSWTNLPNTIQVAVVNRPSTNSLTLQTKTGARLGNIGLPDADNVLVLLKAGGMNGVPAAYVAALPVISTPVLQKVAGSR